MSVVVNKLILDTLCHEIGHVMLGRGHPDDGTCRSVLVWKLSASGAYQQDFRNNRRLMKSGAPGPFITRKELIKKEWDLIDAWLKKQEDDGNL